MAARKKSESNEETEKSVQTAVDVETEQGFRGQEVDPTPNENYTLAGQNAGKPTPETDDATAEKARKQRADLDEDGRDKG